MSAGDEGRRVARDETHPRRARGENARRRLFRTRRMNASRARFRMTHRPRARSLAFARVRSREGLAAVSRDARGGGASFPSRELDEQVERADEQRDDTDGSDGDVHLRLRFECEAALAARGAPLGLAPLPQGPVVDVPASLAHPQLAVLLGERGVGLLAGRGGAVGLHAHLARVHGDGVQSRGLGADTGGDADLSSRDVRDTGFGGVTGGQRGSGDGARVVRDEKDTPEDGRGARRSGRSRGRRDAGRARPIDLGAG